MRVLIIMLIIPLLFTFEKSVDVDITVYQAVEAQTDADFQTTASGYYIVDPEYALACKVIAVSRDMLEEFPYGTEIYLECDCPYEGYYTVEDTMNKRYSQTVDVLIGYNDYISRWTGKISKV